MTSQRSQTDSRDSGDRNRRHGRIVSEASELSKALAEIQASPAGPETGVIFDLDGALIAGSMLQRMATERLVKRDISPEALLRTLSHVTSARWREHSYSVLLSRPPRRQTDNARSGILCSGPAGDALSSVLFIDTKVGDLRFSRRLHHCPIHRDREAIASLPAGERRQARACARWGGSRARRLGWLRRCR